MTRITDFTIPKEGALEDAKEHKFRYAPFNTQENQQCLHEACTSCRGTGIKSDGSTCVHMLSCTCQKCMCTCSV